MISRLLSVVAVMFIAAVGLMGQRLEVLEPLDASGRVTYFIADGLAGSEFRPGDRELAAWALRMWERQLNGALRFEPASEEAAVVRLYWVQADAGQYGEMRPLLIGGRRGAAVYIRPDTDALGGEIATLARRDPIFRDTIVFLTCVHELGHALGMGHTSEFDDIMYSFGYGGDIPAFFGRYRRALSTRADLANLEVLSAGDMRRLRGLYKR